MPRSLLACSVAALALAAAPVAGAAAPTGFTAPQTVGAGVPVSGAVVAADAAGGQPAAVAFADRSGRVWAARVRSDGSLGSPLRTAPLVLFTRQIASQSGVQAQAVAADPATGEATLLADAGSIATPAVAHSGDSLVVAWAAQAGGLAVSVDR